MGDSGGKYADTAPGGEAELDTVHPVGGGGVPFCTVKSLHDAAVITSTGDGSSQHCAPKPLEAAGAGAEYAASESPAAGADLPRAADASTPWAAHRAAFYGAC